MSAALSTPPADPLTVAVIVGSTREGRFGPVVARWIAEQLEEHDDLLVDVIDLDDVDLPVRMPAVTTDALTAFGRRLAAADAFVVVTPEYNHSYPAALKHAIDLAYEEWNAKPVGFVSYGGMSGGLRAVEALRLVFGELHATTIRDTVSFHGASARFDRDGRPLDADGVNGAAKAMIDQLSWWGHALRDARRVRPYGA